MRNKQRGGECRLSRSPRSQIESHSYAPRVSALFSTSAVFLFINDSFIVLKWMRKVLVLDWFADFSGKGRRVEICPPGLGVDP